MRGKPFQPGNKYGCGRPPGSRNQVASKSQAILEEHAEILLKKCVHMALQGDVHGDATVRRASQPILRQVCLRFKMPSVRTMAECRHGLSSRGKGRGTWPAHAGAGRSVYRDAGRSTQDH